MTNEELVRAALEKVGGKSNVLTATNCMTRLRVRVKDDAKIDDEGLKAIEGVMGIVHDRTGYVEIVVGPGRYLPRHGHPGGRRRFHRQRLADQQGCSQGRAEAEQGQGAVQDLRRYLYPPDPGRCGFRSVGRHLLADRSGGAELG